MAAGNASHPITLPLTTWARVEEYQKVPRRKLTRSAAVDQMLRFKGHPEALSAIAAELATLESWATEGRSPDQIKRKIQRIREFIAEER